MNDLIIGPALVLCIQILSDGPMDLGWHPKTKVGTLHSEKLDLKFETHQKYCLYKKTEKKTYRYIHDFSNLPALNDKTDTNGDSDHGVCIVIQDVQHYDQLGEDIKHDAPDAETFQTFPWFPELDI